LKIKLFGNFQQLTNILGCQVILPTELLCLLSFNQHLTHFAPSVQNVFLIGSVTLEQRLQIERME
jgi:hypothetical protein